MLNKDLFLKTYRAQLEKAHRENSQLYAWPVSELDMVFDRMSEAILKGSYNKDSIAFKNTCKELKIKHTYQAITDFIKGTI